MLIGDNLSSHLSLEVIRACEQNDISFIFLPPNSTHLCQPLDVSFFRPLKTAWRQILTSRKKTEGRKQAAIPKDTFPRLLRQLNECISDNAESNIKSGFLKCGIVPLNREKVLERLPEEPTAETETEDQSAASDLDGSFISLLKEMRYGPEKVQTKKRKKKVTVEPGKSVSGADFDVDNENDEPDSEDEDNDLDENNNGDDMDMNASDELDEDTDIENNDAGGVSGRGDTDPVRMDSNSSRCSGNIFERFGVQ